MSASANSITTSARRSRFRPLPTDRVFFDYNHFDQANITANGAVVGLDRYTLGIEKTFCDGLWSVEIKAPIESGLNRIQDPDASTSPR